MFIRKIKTRNSTCFQIGEKRYGRFKLVKHVGCSQSEEEIEALRLKAQRVLKEILFQDQQVLFPDSVPSLKAQLLSWHITGYHHSFGRVYERIGFPSSLLKDLVIARIVYPKSKAATVRYLSRELGIFYDLDRIYRFMDHLDKNKLTKIAFDFVRAKRDSISLVFYDVTTLHFETDLEDNFRQKGFSKNHRGDMPQVLVGLFVDEEGFPFDFSLFEGNTFEGHTFPKAILDLTVKYSLTNLTVVADAGMLSEDNLKFLDKQHFGYIVGARLKNMEDKITAEIITHDYAKENIKEFKLKDQRLIVEFSPIRAQKNEWERNKIIVRLKRRIAQRCQVVRRSKYLSLAPGGKVTGIDNAKIQQDKRFDGLKGFLINASNTAQAVEIIGQYRNLWKVEKAFRMSKNDLKERPVFHQNLKRIKSHLLLCFVALLVMKETEKILNSRKYSFTMAIEVLGKIGEGEVRVGSVRLPMDSELTDETQAILKLFEGY
ncbi:MAG: Transposase [Candidatus Gottesmanbacteria bacterium GW2011_GWC2_39_8]|uniref:Transposase n=1 Tax=Candidatus Gottesmanbacteria bacterium GW2011_GWC2_39_8 TaxID=1618450 RepID=A0A0G0T8C7_9BACT|nr:MAG: Transposase [Candidatus Gottesmanbacteria bacterium GW2011_GWC2_39_8]